MTGGRCEGEASGGARPARAHAVDEAVQEAGPHAARGVVVGALMAGVLVIQRRWWAATGAADDDASRRVWADLLDRLVDRVRAGWASPA